MKFEQLEIGMMTNAGLITRIMPAGTDKFYGKKPSIRFFDLQDSHYGQCTRAVKDDEDFFIVYHVGSDPYRDIVQRLISERYDFIHVAESDVDLLRAYKKLEVPT